MGDMKKIGLFFGGLSNEAAVSVMSARNVVKHFDYRRYQLVLIYWRRSDRQFYLVESVSRSSWREGRRLSIGDFSKLFDIALPMTHGRFGEDGVLQAIFESQGIKYCGCRVLASAICMDKGVWKELASAAGIPQVGYTILDYHAFSSEEIAARLNRAARSFRGPLFVKPANSGSSVGISKVTSPGQLAAAIKEARRHDSRVLIESGLEHPQEVEVAVLGNDELTISRPGELKLAKDFYDYDDKYKLGKTEIVIPASIKPAQAAAIKKLAAQAYRLAGCQGLARVDFFVLNGKIYLNEINTLPGFTDISMFPVLMMDQGMSYQELINKIIRLAY